MLIIRKVENGRLTVWDGPLEEAARKGALWYDLFEPTPEERALVDAAAGVEIPSREDMEEIELSSRLYNEDGVEYMTVTAVAGLNTESPIKSPLLFVLNRSVLVTVRYADLRPLQVAADRMSKPNGAGPACSGEAILLTLLDALVDRLADALEWIGGKVDGISRAVFRSGAIAKTSKRDRNLQTMIESAGREGDLLGLVRESLVSLNRLAGYHLGIGMSDRGAGEAHARMRTIQQDIVALSDHASYISAKIGFILDAALGLISVEQNQIIKIFTIASVCLMPPTLVASIYGMNFKFLPELEFAYGYPMALGLMVVTGLAPYLYFKRKGWI